VWSHPASKFARFDAPRRTYRDVVDGLRSGRNRGRDDNAVGPLPARKQVDGNELDGAHGERKRLRFPDEELGATQDVSNQVRK
jgi:hypothetical protein